MEAVLLATSLITSLKAFHDQQQALPEALLAGAEADVQATAEALVTRFDAEVSRLCSSTLGGGSAALKLQAQVKAHTLTAVAKLLETVQGRRPWLREVQAVAWFWRNTTCHLAVSLRSYVNLDCSATVLRVQTQVDCVQES